MKYLDEFRDGELARGMAETLAAEVDTAREYRLMEFCGGHTHSIARYGLADLLPSNVRLIHGPGCPVCVLPVGRLQAAIDLALTERVILCSYGDMLRVPAAQGRSLLQAKAEGADVRMIYSVDDALRIAEENPQRQVVFFAIGFETTTPPTAVAIRQARSERLTNFSVYCNHVLTPAAIQRILVGPDVNAWGGAQIDGFIGPAHVSAIIGSDPYVWFAEQYQSPVVIAGFEPLDVMQAVVMLIRQLNQGRAQVENQFTRVVTSTGNAKAQQLMREVFAVRPAFEWRGLGVIPHSALAIRAEWAEQDAERRFAMVVPELSDHPHCECPAILRGVKTPTDCKLFGTACTPETPLGSCMVSSEGACAADYHYRRRQESTA